MQHWLVLLAFVLAGCTTPSGDQSDMGTDDPEPSPRVRQAPGDASIVVGTALTYEATGDWDRLGASTVVVAPREGGFLLAGKTHEDLVEELFFPGRPWMGPVDESLNPLRADGTPYWILFDHPLTDGKSWDFSDDATVTARSASLETPLGPLDGFTMTVAAGEDVDWTYSYAPAIGYLIDYTYVFRGDTVIEIRLTAISESEDWVWGEASEETSTCGDATQIPPVPVEAFEVSGADAVLAGAGSGAGGRGATTVGPVAANEAWTHDHVDSQWHYRLMDPTEGTWTLSATKTSDGGYVCIGAVPVMWMDV